jgi:hypothetical protein
MKAGSLRDWLPPTLGAALMLAGAAGLAYKVISGYRHPAPEAFISVQDQNKLLAASTTDHPVEAPTGSADVATPAQSTTTPPPTAPITASPLEARSDWDSASSATAGSGPRAEAQDNLACGAITTEQHEIEGASHKTHSPEEGRYLQRRLVELAEQSAKGNCVK